MKLIENWRAHLKHAWSIRFAALGLLFQIVEAINNSGLLNIWNSMMPQAVREAMPPWANQAISGVLFGAALVAKLIPQKKLSGGAIGQ